MQIFLAFSPTKLHQRPLIQFLISLCLCEIANQKLNTYTNVIKNLEKQPDKNLTLRLSNYCLLPGCFTVGY